MAWYDDILGTGSNIFGAKPADYLVGKEGLLNETEQQKLSQRALTSGLLGTAITYLAQPKINAMVLHYLILVKHS